jgi:hypothetical protein
MVADSAEPRRRTSAALAESTTPSSRPRIPVNGLLAAAGCVLLLLSLDRVVRGVALIPQQLEAMHGESIIYDQAGRLLHGVALYQAVNQAPFTVTAYTPLYYTLVAGLRTVAGPGFGPGRALSLGAGLATAILVGYLAARRATDRRAGIFAAVLFLGLGFPGDYPWFGFYKEDMLGVALSLGAIATLDQSGYRQRPIVAAGILAGLGFLTKQTFILATIAGFVWLWPRNRASALMFAATVLVVAAIPSVLLAVFNDAFLDNTVRANLNPSAADILQSNIEILARYQGVPVAMALLAAASRVVRFRDWVGDPLVVFWIVSLALLSVTLGKVGSNWNYWIGSAAATAPLATQSLWVLLVRAGRVSGLARFAAAAAVIGLLASPAWLPHPTFSLGTVVSRELTPDRQQAEEFAGVLQRVRSEPREVLAEPLDILVLAGREISFEPYIFSVLYRQGEWDPRPVVRQICTGQVGLLVLDHPLDGPDWQYQGYTHWPAPVLDALRARMRLDQTQARLFLYVPLTDAAEAESNANPSEGCVGRT